MSNGERRGVIAIPIASLGAIIAICAGMAGWARSIESKVIEQSSVIQKVEKLQDSMDNAVDRLRKIEIAVARIESRQKIDTQFEARKQ